MPLSAWSFLLHSLEGSFALCGDTCPYVFLTGLQATLGTQLAKEPPVEEDSCLADRIGPGVGHVQ